MGCQPSAIACSHSQRLDSGGGSCLQGVCMGSFGAVGLSACLLITLSAAGQSKNISPAGTVAEHAAQPLKFHIAGIQKSDLGAHAAAPQARDSAPTAKRAEP